ncbi:hypothetical protein AAFF_G00307280, partial [Aldrovandia affinis]
MHDGYADLQAQQWRLTVLTRLGCFLQAVVEERPAEERGTFGDFLDGEEKGRGCVTPLELTWEEHAFRKGGVQVYENSGAQPAVPSSFRL